MKTTKLVFMVTTLIFFAFFVTVNAVSSYQDSRKITLFINGYESNTDERLEGLKVNSMTRGIWTEINDSNETADSYILIKSKSKKVFFSTNDWNELTDYLDQR